MTTFMHCLTGSIVAYIQMGCLWAGLASHHKVKDPRPSSITRTCSVEVGLWRGRFESSSGGNVGGIHYLFKKIKDTV